MVTYKNTNRLLKSAFFNRLGILAQRDRQNTQPLAAAGKIAVIPPKNNRKQARDYDKYLYKACHLIENFFCKPKQFRTIATRHDKTARNFLAGIRLAATMVWLA